MSAERSTTNDERPTTNDQRPMTEAVVGPRSLILGPSCATCSDEALPARVLRIDQEAGQALVVIQGTTAEVDISLVDAVAPGQMLLIHGGAAIGIVATES